MLLNRIYIVYWLFVVENIGFIILLRLYCENIDQPLTTLTADQSHHLVSVMRGCEGDKVEVFDGKGSLATAIIKTATKKKAILEIVSVEKFTPAASGRIILVVSLAKGQRFDWLISKCSELGVDHIVPAIYKRTVKLGSGSKLNQRHKNLAISAAKQCKRLFLPTIDAPQQFEVALERLKKLYPTALLVTASLSDSAQSIHANPQIQAQLDKIVFIGPEGGLTDQEEAFLASKGAIATRLTKSILRVETAAVAISSYLTLQRDA